MGKAHNSGPKGSGFGSVQMIGFCPFQNYVLYRGASLLFEKIGAVKRLFRLPLAIWLLYSTLAARFYRADVIAVVLVEVVVVVVVIVVVVILSLL